MSASNNGKKEGLDKSIRRLIGSEANARCLRSLPLFGVEPELPSDLRLLLRAIDGAKPHSTTLSARSRSVQRACPSGAMGTFSDMPSY